MKKLNLKKKYFLPFGVIVFIIIIIFMFIFMIKHNSPKNNAITNIESNLWDVKYKSIEKDTDVEVLLAKDWKEKEIYEKYNELKYNDNTFYSNKATIEKENIDSFLTKGFLYGYDTESIQHFANADIYKIKDISNNCAVAIKFENDDEYYNYINFKYTPNSLADLVEDLNLKNTIYFETIQYNYEYIDNKNNRQFDNIEFENINDNDIWNLLFYNLSLKNEYSNKNNYSRYIMSIIAKIPLLGYKKISINITVDGYLLTNILNEEEAFFIGEEKVKEFVQYISKNYKGYKIIYENPNNSFNVITNTLN